METLKRPWRASARALDPESLLEEYFTKLQRWALVLTRGDRGMAEEIVQDLCLYFTVSRPDLSKVANLDGYLYTSLRHLYLSALSRSSREAVQNVDIADFDSIHFALKTRSSDGLLERQNELRRICNYTVWRKRTAKSASYFILHFFHDYERSEIASIAQLPIAAIYNKLKAAREEVKSHLDESEKLRIARREMPPEPKLALSLASSSELFDELQQWILDARDSDCLSERQLLSHYEAADTKPIPCNLLSHIVSCPNCLAIVSQHLQRPSDEDDPATGSFDSWSEQRKPDPRNGEAKSFTATMREVHSQGKRVRDHRPRSLSIAVDGKIIAFHDVQSERSTLAARIEHPESAQFIEVFTDQHIRLAMLPVEESPHSEPHDHKQQVALTDDRWLELTLSFDGQGLHSEVTYVDPTLSIFGAEEMDEQPIVAAVQIALVSPRLRTSRSSLGSLLEGIQSSFRNLSPRFVFAGAMTFVVILSAVGYLTYRNVNRPPESATQVLNRSIEKEAIELKGQTERQVLQLEAVNADEQLQWRGTVDVWKENDSGKTMRRLYDAQHRLVAEAWQAVNGQSGVDVGPNRNDLSDADREIADSEVWQQDVSAKAFRQFGGERMQVHSVGSDYELVVPQTETNSRHIQSATLLIDRNLHVVGETLRIGEAYSFRKVRLVRADYQVRPSGSVPANVFEPSASGDSRRSEQGSYPAWNGSNRAATGLDNRLVQLEIAVLYELNELGADIGEPIEVTRTADGHIRVAGTVADDTRRREIKGGLEALADHQSLDLRLESQGNLRIPRKGLERATPLASKTYSVAQTEAPVDALLQKHFAGKGWTSERIKSATAQFSQDTLRHSQRALQHAYALDRLGAQFTPGELQAAGQNSDRLWTEMAKRHAAALESELRELRAELLQFEPAKAETLSAGKITVPMEGPADFALAARELLRETQSLNRYIGEVFTTSLAVKKQRDPERMISDAISAIPTLDAGKMAAFATRLSNSDNAANRPIERGK